MQRPGPSWCRVADGCVIVTVLVVPGASRERVVGLHGDALRAQVSAAPEAGRANRAVVALVARWAGLAEREVTLVAGTTSRRKSLRLASRSPGELAQRLTALTS